VLIELPTFAVLALNIAGWPVIHLSVAWAFTRLPNRMFEGGGKLLKPRAAEAKFYTNALRIRAWKSLLPDAAPWLNGVPKRNLKSRDAEYLKSFIVETRRGEAAHWTMMFVGPVFLLWNPPWADAVMIAYAIAANLPCIVTQRYNRLRLESIQRTKSESSVSARIR
jgi:glycosyl-4,4'-diaponeurosporenoate acyltransferase